MVEELRLARRGQHASNLGALLALRFAQAAGVNAYIVDPVTVDEWQECARLTGSPLIERTSIGHALNTKAVARRFAREQGSTYQALRLIVAHLGSGITVSAHQDGRMIDSNSIEEGPFGVDRSGGLPVRALARLCFSGQYTEAQLDRQLFGDGGLFAYLGTRDLIEVERRIDEGPISFHSLLSSGFLFSGRLFGGRIVEQGITLLAGVQRIRRNCRKSINSYRIAHHLSKASLSSLGWRSFPQSIHARIRRVTTVPSAG